MGLKSVKSTGDVFQDLGFSREESTNLRLRSICMIEFRRYVLDRGLTQAEAAKAIGASQPRVSDLMKGKIDKFSLDFLVNALSSLGIAVDLHTEPAAEGALEEA